MGTVGCWGGVGWARCWVLREQPEGCSFRVATHAVCTCGGGVGVGGCGLVPLSQTAGIGRASARWVRVGAGVRVLEPVVA